jgi:arginine:pyruvate transaminase
MPGFRFGWIVGPPALSAHLFDLLVAMIYGSPAFIQDGVMPALERDLPEMAALREAYRNRAGMLSETLSEAPNCRVTRPEGGMFVLMDIRSTGVASTAFAHELLMREHVAVLPCDGFGPSAAGHLRISLTAAEPRLAEAGRRIVRFARSIAG